MRPSRSSSDSRSAQPVRRLDAAGVAALDLPRCYSGNSPNGTSVVSRLAFPLFRCRTSCVRLLPALFVAGGVPYDFRATHRKREADDKTHKFIGHAYRNGRLTQPSTAMRGAGSLRGLLGELLVDPQAIRTRMAVFSHPRAERTLVLLSVKRQLPGFNGVKGKRQIGAFVEGFLVITKELRFGERLDQLVTGVHGVSFYCPAVSKIWLGLDCHNCVGP